MITRNGPSISTSPIVADQQATAFRAEVECPQTVVHETGAQRAV